MAAAGEGTWRVELTCRKVRQYSCDSALAAMQHSIPLPDDAGRHAWISEALAGRNPTLQRGKVVTRRARSGRVSRWTSPRSPRVSRQTFRGST